MSANTKNYQKQGGREWVVGGLLTVTGTIAQTLTNASATPGTVRAAYNKAVTGVALTSGNLVGQRGEVQISTGATVGNGVFLYGNQGKITLAGAATINSGSGHVCGVLGSLDLTNSTNTSGHIAGVISTIQGVGSDGTLVDLFYGESATGTPVNSMFKAFGKATYVMDIATNTHTQAAVAGTAGALTSGWLKVLVEGVVRYIPLAASVS